MINQNRKTMELKVKEKENQTLTRNLARTLTRILAKILTGFLAKTCSGNVDMEEKPEEERSNKVDKEEKEATIMEQYKILDPLEDEKKSLLDKVGDRRLRGTNSKSLRRAGCKGAFLCFMVLD